MWGPASRKRQLMVDEQGDWPPIPTIEKDDPQADVKKVLYQAQVQLALSRQQAADDEQKAQAAEDAESRKTAWTNEYALRQTAYSAYVDVSKTAIDRAQARAQFVQTAAAAVSTAYVGILAFAYKLDNTNPSVHPLPLQGLLPTVFLGLAIVLVTVYLSYLGRRGVSAGPEAGRSLLENQENRLNAFVDWTADLIIPRLYFLHASVASLAVGLGVLPFAFVDLPVNDVLILGAIAAIAVFVAPLFLRAGTSTR